ncbi:hypothetical protein [Ornithinimicrobium sp. LYQ103]|uniref:hypothetical protein n=1 Tax=Ornithinimicrobium sp. LYQ103 TaxID=3378796 RepID=UPI0038531115
MSFEDLPRDWAHRSLDDPVLTADILDLVVSDLDRAAGGVMVLLCQADGRLSQPVFVGEIGSPDVAMDVISFMAPNALDLPGVGGLVVALVRGSGAVTDLDRRVHQHTLEVCGRAGLALFGTFVVTRSDVVHLPVASDLRLERGVA